MESLRQNKLKMFINKIHLVESIFTNVSIGIIVTNHQGEIILANPFMLAQFGYQEDELAGKKVEVLIPKQLQQKHTQHRKNFNMHLQNRAMGIGIDLYGVRKDGTEFPVEVSLCHYSKNEDNFVIAFINNITIRKKAEQEIYDLKDNLEKKIEDRTQQLKEILNKLEISKEELAFAFSKEKELNEMKFRFISIASHEFKTPLSTILSSAYLLQQYTSTEEQAKREKHIERITASANTLIDILNDFLSVGKIEEGKIHLKWHNFNISELIDLTIGEIKDSRKPGQKILHRHVGEANVLLDASIMKHIVLNLLSNAIKFSPEKTDIEINSKVKNGQLLIVVKDQGMGISKEDQAYLFERFFRGENVNNIEGTGLGLHIVAKYVELMNGTIACDSMLGKGTTMTLVFNSSIIKNLA